MMSLHRTYRGLACRRGRSHGAVGLRALAMTGLAAQLVSLCGIAAAQEQKKPAKPLPKLNLGEIIERAGRGVVQITIESQAGEKRSSALGAAS